MSRCAVCRMAASSGGFCEDHWRFLPKPLRDVVLSSLQSKASMRMAVDYVDVHRMSTTRLKWKPLVDYRGMKFADFRISEYGHILRLWSDTVQKWEVNTSHYPQLKLRGTHWRFIHLLVAETFIGPCPEGLQVNHKDNNKMNAHVSNFEFVTQGENKKHAVAIGLVQHRTRDEVARLKKKVLSLAGKRTVSQIAGCLGMSTTSVRKIISGDR